MDYKNTVKIPRSAIHCHSEYSNTKNLDCIIKLKDLIHTAHDMGFKSIAITDHECISSHIKAQAIEKEIQKEDPNFKVCLGNEIYLVETRNREIKQKFYHFLLIAKDEIGHKYLRELSTRAWQNAYVERGQNRTATLYSDFEDIVKEKGHLIATNACIGGLLGTKVIQYIENKDIETKKEIDNFLKWCINIFGKDDFYVELQAAVTEEQKQLNLKLIPMAKYYGVKCIITDDVHYLHREDRTIHEAYLNSRDSKERELGEFYEACFFKTDEDLKARLSYFDEDTIVELCKNTVEVTGKVQHYELKKDVIVPQRKLPEFTIGNVFQKYYGQYEYIEKFAKSQYTQDLFLLYQIENGFLNKKQEFNEINLSRLNIELQTLWLVSEKLKQRLSSYYNLTQEVINIMWDEQGGNSIVGISRGSASGMYFCYLIDIIQMNPIKHDLCWWRHLHSDRPELPDIDTDTESLKRPNIFAAFKNFYGEDKVLNIITFRGEGSKSSILTSARGLGIPLEEAQEIADMIPIKRGKAYTISECMYGDGDEKQPVKNFANLLKSYEGLEETALKIEGLVCGVSSHASGLYIFNQDFTEQNSLMRTPRGQNVTCWDMLDSDTMGALKIDILTIENLDTIHATLDLLIKDNLIERQSTLRATYNKYLHPDVLDYESKDMWDMLSNGKANNIFQLSTDVGKQACKLIAPHSLKETALVNSLMRLSGDNEELPLAKYKRFKDNIQLWYDEMKEAKLTQDEIALMEKYLLRNKGLAAEQEDVMELTMDKNIANFSMAEANKLRKGIAKKSQKTIEDCKKMFYDKGIEAGTRKELLDYVWNKQISLSLGYSFSRNHTTPYSCIGLQQLNLLYKYPAIYSHTAYLLINSSSNDNNNSNKIDYGAIATTISECQRNGVKFSLPDINIADYGFSPQNSSNSIMFGLKGINSINSEIANMIILNRPYSNFSDFVQKNNLSKIQMINLIKSGSFDNLVKNMPRTKIMTYYLCNTIKAEKEYKTKITAANFNTLSELHLIEEQDKNIIHYYNYNKHITDKSLIFEKVKNKTWIIAKDLDQTFFEQNYIDLLEEAKDYRRTKEGIVFCKSSYNKIYKQRINKFLLKLNQPAIIEKYNKAIWYKEYRSIYDKYCEGSVYDWEFDSLSFYYSQHALKDINANKYNISSFKELSEEPIIEEEYEYKGKTWSRKQISRICGTILDNDRNKHTISILTNDYEVVQVKFYSGAFIQYNKTIKDEKTGEKEDSWLSRGNKLLVVGYRSNDSFIPKVYSKSIYRHSVSLIKGINSDGSLELQTLRLGQIDR